MTRTLLSVALMTLTLTAHAADTVELKTLEQKIGYGAGMQMGQTLIQSGMDMDEAAVIQGLKDALAGREPKLSGRDMREAFVIGQEKADHGRENDRKEGPLHGPDAHPNKSPQLR
mgnify:CR=1 FL=1